MKIRYSIIINEEMSLAELNNLSQSFSSFCKCNFCTYKNSFISVKSNEANGLLGDLEASELALEIDEFKSKVSEFIKTTKYNDEGHSIIITGR